LHTMATGIHCLISTLISDNSQNTKKKSFPF
jgi:hypothetical protein